MHLYKNKKIILYIFFFLLFGTINNTNLFKLNSLDVTKLEISGLEDKDRLSFEQKINNLNFDNIFLLKKENFNKIINSYNIIEDIYIFKKYPSTLEIKINKTNYLANILIDENFFFLGSNGKLIKSDRFDKNLPNLFGLSSYNNFLKIKQKIDESKIIYKNIKNFFYFPVGRWDIELNNGILLKLPVEDVIFALDYSFEIMELKNFDTIKVIDLRIPNQIIIE